MSNSIAVLGLGAMGSAIAVSLIEHGEKVVVWNRSSGKAQRVSELGARVADSVTDACAQADVIVVVTATPIDVASDFEELGEGLQGKTIVNLATGRPSEVQALDRLVSRVGAKFISGTIQCFPPDIGRESATILFGAEVNVWNEVEPFVRKIAPQSVYVGARPDVPNVLDAGLTGTFVFGAGAAFLEGLRFIVNSGMSIDEIRGLIPTYIAGQARFIEGLFESVAASDYQPRGANLDVYARAVALFQQAQEDAGLPPRILKALRERILSSIAEGDGDRGYAALFNH
ncbi:MULTISPECIES: NAD(P)-dependent oxidoreductase [Burkholderia cepacia complex]|jgi:3-hydroxyisobutyrate dehydrogenase-like beta-hydroxyacid dehydrogenase|uniref:NAD(P)-dependent oxidoreductase n=1 Tax=Burkholderia cepacia complex TaxID=87882 RepID=UPI0004F5FC1C|nr:MULTISPECIES: NAD(P)-binding domain-containing protein [Burkholderia cepacia complex]AIO44869.1 ketopantoate reductase PanE/ApbA family protein [Burkholderia cepacia]AQQ21347.1 hydroxyacid dehydrogenase [Burkholderia cenocepacia]AQQ47072.1 hydroxyacid dehydrogenase [Burkholderia cenocepacia]KGC02774.1 ketopantoate reductase PanE/ApbA family protein [Burkholderia cepacia]MBO1855401.1 NAD(P)-dependent oxidoreductase [Burkholderia cenocepacia]